MASWPRGGDGQRRCNIAETGDCGAAGVMGPETLARAGAAVAARRAGTVDVQAALAELAHG